MVVSFEEQEQPEERQHNCSDRRGADGGKLFISDDTFHRADINGVQTASVRMDEVGIEAYTA